MPSIQSWEKIFKVGMRIHLVGNTRGHPHGNTPLNQFLHADLRFHPLSLLQTTGAVFRRHQTIPLGAKVSWVFLWDENSSGRLE